MISYCCQAGNEFDNKLHMDNFAGDSGTLEDPWFENL